MSKSIKGKFSSTIIGILIAIIGVIMPIAWDWWVNTSAIELTCISSITLAEKKSNLERLKIFYDDRQVESLSKIEFELRNAGRKAIIETDLVEAPIITLKDGEIFDISIEKLYPDNVKANITLKAPRSVSISFPLLNPNDLIRFSILVSSNLTSFSAKARIKNIKQIDIVDNISPTIKRKSINFRLRILGLNILGISFGVIITSWFKFFISKHKQKKKEEDQTESTKKHF